MIKLKIITISIFVFLTISISAQDAAKETDTDKEDLKKSIQELENSMKKNQADLDKLKAKAGVKTEDKKEGQGYVSPYKKDGIPADLMRHQFLDPVHTKQMSKDQSMWFGDIFRAGFLVRPRYEDRYNLTFNAHNKDYTSRIMQTTQVWFLVDPSPYLSLKVTIQDSRLWGGSQPAPVGDVRQFVFSGSGTTVPTTGGTVVRNPTDVREAFGVVKGIPIPLKIYIGRQIVAYGDQRVIGGANWTQNGLSYDGLRFAFDFGNFKPELFGFKLTTNQDGPNGILSQNKRSDSYLVGSYNTMKWASYLAIDLYAFGYLQKAATATSSPYRTSTGVTPYINLPNAALTSQDRTQQQNNLYTIGARFTNRTENNNLPKGESWDWTIEGTTQTGFNGLRTDPINSNPLTNANFRPDVNYLSNDYNLKLNPQLYTQRQKYAGYYYVIQTGYTFFEKLRVGVQYNISSGDPNRNDAKVSTFQTLTNPRFGTFPYWNSVSGLSENIDTKNLNSKSLQITYTSDKFGMFQFAFYDLSKTVKQDAWYAINGTANTGLSTESYTNATFSQNAWYQANGSQAASFSKGLGKGLYNEYDLSWLYRVNDNVSVWAGAGYLVAKDAIRNARNNVPAVDTTNPTPSNLSAGQLRTNFDPIGRMFFFQINMFM